MGKNKFFNQNEINDSESNYVQNNQLSEFDSHGNSKEEYSDQIYVNESKGKEAMFDRRDPLVRLILLILGLVAVIGTIYYIYVYVTTMR